MPQEKGKKKNQEIAQHFFSPWKKQETHNTATEAGEHQSETSK